MADPRPNFDLPPVSEKSSAPWVVIVLTVALMAVAGWVIFSGKPQKAGRQTAVTALEEQLDKDRAALDEERRKTLDMTQQLEAMKQAYQLGQVPDKRQAIGEYTKLQAAHDAQRAKVKALMDKYNEKLANLQKLK